MRALLDTHALLWFWEGNTLLSPAARAAIETAENEKLVSHVSVWEIVVKLSLGKLSLTIPFDELFPSALDSSGFSLLPTKVEHFRALLDLPFHHRDPFDRLLIAQCRAEGLTLLSGDRHFKDYDVPLLW